MNKYIKFKFNLILIFLLSFIIVTIILKIRFDYVFEDYSYLKFETNEISIVVNFKDLTNNKHRMFYEIMRKVNSSRNFYFIKSNNTNLNPYIDTQIKNSSVKIIKSNFPDTIFLPLIISLFGKTIPKYVLFIEGEEFNENFENSLIEWIFKIYKLLMNKEYDYIFGNSQFINGNKIGCSILFVDSSILEHLLYYTNSDTTHIHPFVQLSLANDTKFCFIQIKNIISKNTIQIDGNFSINMNCPLINDKESPSLCIVLPNFKRNYLSHSFSAFSNQTYKPKFYLIIQNDDRIHYNLSFIQKEVKEPIYHIWMQNFNSFFF